MSGAARDAHDPPSRTSNWLLRHGKWLIIGPPMLYLLVFFLIPFAFALKISFADTAVRVPPFTDILTIGPDWHIHLTLSLSNFQYLFTDEIYGVSYLYSIRTAFFSTLVCLALGYPMAYAIARTSKSTQSILLLFIILPFWTSFLLRVYALEGIIRETGLLNSALIWLGIIHKPLQIMHTTLAVYLGIIYSYLPFMVLPLFATLEKLDHSLNEAAADLGSPPWRTFLDVTLPLSVPGIIYSYLPFMVLPLFATLEKLDHSLNEAAADLGSPPWRTFLDVTLPLSVPGIIAGSMLVFIPAVGEFVIPTLLGGPDNLMIGRILWDEFFGNRDWPVASAVAVAFLILLVGPIALYQHYSTKQLEA
jgi:putrescine transport system permease protein